MGKTSEMLRQDPGNTEFLVDKAKGGSESAWREILRRYRTMLVFHVRARIHGISKPDLEDLLARVVSKLLVRIHHFRYQGEGSFRRWLAKIVVNECRNELQRREMRKAETQELSEIADRSVTHTQAAADETDEQRRLIEQLGELDEYDRDLLIMRYFEDLPWTTISEVLGCSLEKAKGDYERAFRRLARRLGA